MPARARSQRTIDEAIKRAPMTIAKQHRGQTPRRERKSFRAWTVSQLLERCDPRQVLLDIAAMPTEDLMAKAGCSYLDATAERRLAALACLPYLCSKLPVQIDMKSTRTIHLNLVTEDQYQELVAVAATEDANNDSDSFNMQLIAAQPVQETTDQADESPEPQSPPTERSDHRTPVTPSVAADVPGVTWLAPEGEFFDRLNKTRTRSIEDTTPARDDRDSWQRTHEGGVWPPDRSK